MSHLLPDILGTMVYPKDKQNKASRPNLALAPEFLRPKN